MDLELLRAQWSATVLPESGPPTAEALDRCCHRRFRGPALVVETDMRGMAPLKSAMWVTLAGAPPGDGCRGAVQMAFRAETTVAQAGAILRAHVACPTGLG